MHMGGVRIVAEVKIKTVSPVYDFNRTDGKRIPVGWKEEIRNMTEEEIRSMKQEENEMSEPTQEDRIEAQVMYTALMTDTLLEE